MQADKKDDLFQTMVVVNLNMGNLNMEVSNLKKKLVTKEKERATLHEELDKERDFQKEYKHNIEIWRKNKTENGQKIKTFIFKVKEENAKLKEKMGLMKS
jgi:chromosome segregation ATPase